ncbi:DUF5629 family protein [Pseudomonas putida]|uniref:DUF5629 domain-containing protein n=1 Tax=Pseudomonas putida TaxID=303 RepID=A0A1Q9R4C5_PSEPU|nr:DUF5629 family protein [Pseudomonas putida]OLS62253.1 hypothetical protein PSEMO_31640 [Pseudomonas putida]
MTTLSQALHTCDMLLIDGLHCFDFVHDDSGLRAECMDGRALKRWTFTAAQVEAARAEGEDWLIVGDSGEHRLVCMGAVRAPEDDEDDEYEEGAAEPADR